MTTTDESKIEMVDPDVAAELFKKDSAAYVHGQFGSPTPQTVQKAIDAGNLYATLLGDVPQVLVMCNLVKSGSTHLDFAQNKVKIKAGELFANHIAKAPDALDQDIADLLDNIQSRHGLPMWVEIYEEDGAKRRVLDAADFAYIATKVNAYGDLTGLYYRPWPPVRLESNVIPLYDVEAHLEEGVKQVAHSIEETANRLREVQDWLANNKALLHTVSDVAVQDVGNTKSAASVRMTTQSGLTYTLQLVPQ